MSDTEQRRYYYRFPDLQGFDRILRSQKFPARERLPEHGKGGNGEVSLVYSLPALCNSPDSQESGDHHTIGDSCNIVILGAPGTGKSTLALNMAETLRRSRLYAQGKVKWPPETPLETPPETWPSKPATTLYYGLEQSRSSLINRAHEMASNEIRAVWMEGPGEGDGLPAIGQNMCKKLREKLHEMSRLEKSCAEGGPNLVLFPLLSPRPLEQTAAPEADIDADVSIFWKRYGEIKNLIAKLSPENKSEETNRIPPLSMVVIDSLNVFGDRPISRYLLEQLFALFAETRVIGVFIAEDPEQRRQTTPQEPVVSAGLTNLADVVLKLGWKKDEDYAFRHIEVVKSRHTPNVYGTQQMKIREHGISIYPSLHSWYTYLRSQGGQNPDNFAIGGRLEWIKCELAHNMFWEVRRVEKELPGFVYLISGPKKTHKSSLALDYAAHQDTNGSKDRPGFLLVTLDESILSIALPRSESQVAGFTITHPNDTLDGLIPSSKGTLKSFTATKNGNSVHGCELWLTPGYLLGEECVFYLYKILTEVPSINRVVLRDIGQLSLRHPIMARHVLNGKSNYLPVLLELFKRLKKDCMFVCTTEDDSKEGVEIRRGVASAAHFHIETLSGERQYSGQLITSQ